MKIIPIQPRSRPCETCCGNGEIVTDWERYKHPRREDIGDEALADCPDCNGTGYTDQHEIE